MLQLAATRTAVIGNAAFDEEMNRFALERMRDTMLWIRQDGKIIHANAASAHLTGYSTDVLELMSISDLLACKIAQPWEETFAHLRTVGNLRNAGEFLKADGSIFLCEVDCSFYKNGATELILCMITDLTNDRALLAEISEAKTQLQTAVETANLGFWEWCIATNYVYVSPELLAHVGQTPGTQWDASFFQGLLHPDDVSQTILAVQQTIENDKPYSVVFRLRHVDGSYRKIESRGKLFRSPQGEPTKFVGVHRDVTDLRLQESKFEAIFHHAFQFIGIMSTEGVLLEANRSSLDAAGVLPSDVIGKRFWETPWWTHCEKQQIRLKLAIQRASFGEMDRFQATHFTSQGQMIYVDFSIKPVLDEKGDVVLLVPEGRDITQFHNMNERLRISEERFELATRVSGDGLWDWDLVNDIFWVSPRYREILGYDPDDRIGFTDTKEAITSHLHPDDQAAASAAAAQNRELGSTFDIECRVRKKNGKYIWIRSRGDCSRDENGKAIRMTGSHQDIDKEKRLSVDLRLAQISLETANDAIYWINSEGRFVYANKIGCERLGYALVELRTKSVFDTSKAVSQSSWPELSHKLKVTKGLLIETIHRRKDGSEFPVEISAHAIEVGEDWLFCSTVRDLSERNAKQQELLQSNQDLERFAFAASHDLREPLRAIAGYCEILLEDHATNLDDEGQRCAVGARSGAHRMQRLISDLLEYSRLSQQALFSKKCAIGELFQNAVTNLHSQMVETGAIVTIEDTIPDFSGDATLLELLFQNLISNAIKFSRPKVIPIIKVSGSTDGTQTLITIKDNGIGMDPAHASKIFDVFCRLHSRDAYEGTGIGLAICKRIIDRHGATISVHTALGEGTEFVMNFNH